MVVPRTSGVSTLDCGLAQACPAEFAKLHGAHVETAARGASSAAGYIAFSAPEESASWTVRVGAEGSYDLCFQYSLEAGSDKAPLAVQVNKQHAATLTFHETGAWETTAMMNVTVPLAQGLNAVQLQSVAGGTSWPHIHHVQVYKPDLVQLEPAYSIDANGNWMAPSLILRAVVVMVFGLCCCLGVRHYQRKQGYAVIGELSEDSSMFPIDKPGFGKPSWDDKL